MVEGMHSMFAIGIHFVDEVAAKRACDQSACYSGVSSLTVDAITMSRQYKY